MRNVSIRNARTKMAVAWAKRIAAGLAATLILYLTAGLIGGAIPVHRDWRQPANGVTIWVESNGIHTGIVVPKVAAGVDWRALAKPGDLRDPRYAGYDHLSFGWGERAFYLETPTWWDVRPATVLAAAIGSARTLVHVDHVPAPAETPSVRRIVVTPDQYRRLAAYIAASVKPGGGVEPGYFKYDAFYEGTGRYSAVRTCNAWTGAALATADIRVGAWTPFPVTVLWWF